MRLARRPNVIVVLGLLVATLASLGPHMMILGYTLADAKPPAALVFLCPLHRLEAPSPSPASSASRLVLHAKPYRATGSR
jgi:hypothetical protein